MLLAVLLAVFLPRPEAESPGIYYSMEDYDLVAGICEMQELDSALLMALIHTESGFDPLAVSAVGARGLTQIMPDTFDWLRSKTGDNLTFDDLFRPEVSVRYGAVMLKYLLDEFGEPETALAAYHAGRGRVNQWLRDPAISVDGYRIDEIPSSDTRHYVFKVMRAYAHYIEAVSERQQETSETTQEITQ